MEEKQEVVIQQQYVPQADVVNQGSVAIEQSRAVAEAQGGLLSVKFKLAGDSQINLSEVGAEAFVVQLCLMKH